MGKFWDMNKIMLLTLLASFFCCVEKKNLYDPNPGSLVDLYTQHLFNIIFSSNYNLTLSSSLFHSEIMLLESYFECFQSIHFLFFPQENVIFHCFNIFCNSLTFIPKTRIMYTDVKKLWKFCVNVVYRKQWSFSKDKNLNVKFFLV